MSDKKHFYLTMTCEEIDQLRAIGNGSLTAGLRTIVGEDISDFTLDMLYTHRTSVRLSPEDLQTFKDIGGGNITKGIRRSLYVSLSKSNQIN
tara:strand:+ start:112 stop:387 length:276 start_codon:yes stop_codon:yes gene_type:complete